MKSVKPTQPEAAQVQDIILEQLVPSRFEARKTIEPSALAELAESIRAKGVLEPLIVRPVPELRPEEDPRFEIGAGQRRWQASKLAGKTTVPCLVRLLSDDELRELGIISNLQREGLEPIDEAEAYGRLLALPGATVETVAAKVAKSPSYVGRRLKLLDAARPVRDALKLGAIEVGHAMELARLSGRQQQDLLSWLDIGYEVSDEGGQEEDDLPDDYDDEEICKYCDAEADDLEATGRAWWNEKRTVCNAPSCVAAAGREAAMGGWHPTRTTVAELRHRIERTELRILGQAPFPLEDEIPPIACTECPKRSGNTHGLFDDVLQDTCTDPECYDTKLKVWVKAELQKTPELVMLYDGHAADKAGVAKWNVVVNADCAKQEPAIWVSGRSIGRRLSICRDGSCKAHGKETAAPKNGGGGSKRSTPAISAADKAKAEAQRAEREKLRKKVEAEKAYRERLWNRLAAAGVPDMAEPQIVRQVCAHMATLGGALVARVLGLPDEAFDYGRRSESLSRVEAMPYKALLRAAALALVNTEIGVSEYTVSQGMKPTGMEGLAKLLNLDVAELRGDKPAAKKKPTAPALEPAAKKGQRSSSTKLSPEARERIAAAQKKRFATAIKATKKAPAKKTAKKGGKR